MASNPTNRSVYPPANSIIARILPAGEEELFYPFFSTHFMLPLKIGEVVWVTYPDTPSQGDMATPETLLGGSADSDMLRGGTNNITSDIDAIRTQTSGKGPFQRAIVTEVILSPVYPTISEEGDWSTPEPHNMKGGFWFSRVVGSRLSEDLNFTHVDRDLDMRVSWFSKEGASVSDALGDMGEYIPDFPNGRTLPIVEGSDVTNADLTNKDNSRTLTIESADYPRIVQNSMNSWEPSMPAVKGSEGDFVINGSNNTSIILGAVPRIVSPIDEAINETTMGKISITVGKGFTGNIPDQVTSLNTLGQPEFNKAFELSETIFSDPDLMDKWQQSHTPGLGNASINLYGYRNAAPEYITGADANGTFPATVTNAGTQTIPTIPFSNPQSGETEPEEVDLTEGSEAGSYVTVKSDHIRIGANQTLRLGVSADTPDDVTDDTEGYPGAEIILHKDGNIFIKPGKNGKVYLGGGPDSLMDEHALDEETSWSTYCDMVCYPDGKEMDEGGVGLVAEMATIAKSDPSGRPRHSSTVKVKQ
jgi:hypothetical protein